MYPARKNQATTHFIVSNGNDLNNTGCDNLIEFSSLKFTPVTPKVEASNPKKYTMRKADAPVMPIKDKSNIELAKQYFLNRPERYRGQNIRDYTLFVLGINVGLRAGDLLHLHISDLTRYNFEQIVIMEQKTRNRNKPPRVIHLSTQVRNILKDYISTLERYNEDDYLFGSRSTKRANKQVDPYYPLCKNQPIDLSTINRKLKSLEEELNLNCRLRTHSLRKTFAYQKLKANENNAMYLSVIQKTLCHSSAEVTLRYVGIEAEQIADVYLNDVL